METSAHVQTIAHGDVTRYYYRECSCGYQGPARERIGDACEDQCPSAIPVDPETAGTRAFAAAVDLVTK